MGLLLGVGGLEEVPVRNMPLWDWCGCRMSQTYVIDHILCTLLISGFHVLNDYSRASKSRDRPGSVCSAY